MLGLKVFIAVLAVSAPGAALAFCGGWDEPVAFGFDLKAWSDKWGILSLILVSVGIFSTIVVRQWRYMRSLPVEEV